MNRDEIRATVDLRIIYSLRMLGPGVHDHDPAGLRAEGACS